MSYLSEGALGLGFGVLIVLIRPIIGLFLIVLGISLLAVGASAETPGTHISRCSWLGHDWRTNMKGVAPGKRCRNCLKFKGGPDVNTGYVPVVPVYAPPPGYGPPVYGAPVMAAPAMPTATQRAAYAPPVQQLVCPACRSPVQAGMQFCPWCNRPFGQ